MNDQKRAEKEWLNVASRKYGFHLVDLIEHDKGYQNIIYEYQFNNQSFILRISQAATRSLGKLTSELDFLNHLGKHGVPVSLPITSKDGNFIEVTADDVNTYYMVAFNKAQGAHITYGEYLNNPNLYYHLGKLTGKIHKSSKLFPQHLNRRHDWPGNDYLKHFFDYVPSDESEKKDALESIRNELDTIPKDDSNFGLIHGDINVGNFFVDRNNITLFDFDECQNSWYIEDIAIQLFYTVYVFGDDSVAGRKEKALEFMQHFLRGYHTEQSVDIEMIKRIPQFLILREIIVHVGIYKKWDLSNLSGWAIDYFRDSSRRIVNRLPLVEYDPEWHNI